MEIDGFPVVETTPPIQFWTIESFVNGESVNVSVHQDLNYVVAVENSVRPKGVDIRICCYTLASSKMFKGTYDANPS